ncbi:aminodeoxychorismate/anthranilate synthase component II [Moraxella lincolnii]|uniref:anthranilate synthase component II n=1 Tax=Lwoffella lincolnii TaxID=90241 RepID=UPI0030D60CB9
MLLFIDNFDSFTYNLVQYFEQLGQTVLVKQNDAVSIEQIQAITPDAIVIGPGPGTPDNSGISLTVIERLAGVYPILGVCLGHQVIAQVFGAKIVPAEQIMHGRISAVHHDGKGLFVGLIEPFLATRYHSLLVDKDSLPQCLQVSAWTQDGLDGKANIKEIMGICHHRLPLYGVQFHPESILSQAGLLLLNNFLRLHGLSDIDSQTLPTTTL